MKKAPIEITRARLEAKIEELIRLLDLVDGDENLEETGDLEPSFGAAQYKRGRLEYDLEEDIADAEPFLGWSEHESLHNCNPNPNHDEFGPVSAGPKFDGDGHHIGRKLLREHVKDQRKLTKALDATRVAPGYGRHA
ncbi:hypothetical protein [Rhizobium rhizogenes]|uniref:hypothetical protein n=1 Tax=Rhizobium rhizogenes TaxID=359 RepID=UPI0022C90E37|nr:hypothetical protein [Rhizobium rhizogenes]MCZ7463526.1 hypothetical protein [Rhizobium rhizogenes]